MIKKYDFFKTKYGEELLIDLISLESLEKYITEEHPHYLSYYDITLVTGGNGSFTIDQFKYTLERGLLLFTSPGQVRHWDFEVLPTGYVLIFEEEFLSCFLNDSQFVKGLKYFNTYSSPPCLVISESDIQYIKGIAEDIKQEIQTFNTTDKAVLRALLLQVLVWLNRKYTAAYPSADNNNNNRHIQLFTSLVNQEFSKQHSVTYYAGRINITPDHLNDLCKIHLGLSAKQYILKRIMLEAKRQLLFTDQSIAEIALNLNFEDSSYFVRKFKLDTGITPLAFRKSKNP